MKTKTPTSRASRFPQFLAISLGFALAPVAHAVTYWWDGSSSATWGTTANWSTVAAGGTTPTSPTVPDSTIDVIYNATGLNTNQTVTLGGSNRAALSLTFSSTGTTQLDRASTTSASSSTLTVGSGGISLTGTAGAVTIGDTLSTGQKVNMQAAASLNIDNDSAALLTFNRTWTSSAASGTTTLSLTGSGTGGTTFVDAISNGATATVALSVNTSAGVTTLSSANSYGGGTTLTQGTLALGSATALGSGGLIINGGTLASVTSPRTIANNVTVGGNFKLGGLSQSLTMNGTMNLGGATRTITLDNSATIGGVISNGGLTIASSSAARSLTLNTASNTYSGATLVSSGTLLVNGALANSSSVTVSSLATLGGDGSIANAVTVNSGGFLQPGVTVGVVGSLDSGALTLNGSYLTTITANGINDFLNITGAANFAGTIAPILFGYTPAMNDAFNLADWSGSYSGTPTFDYTNAALSGGLAWDSTTFATDGTLRVIPEPAAALLGSFGLLSILRRRRI